MSATGRGATRKAHDLYSTPRWAVDRLLERVDLPGGRWLEPCAGEGRIIQAVNETERVDISWTAIEIMPECRARLDGATEAGTVHIGDFLKLNAGGPKYAVAITNPPYFHAKQFVQRCQQIASVTVMLLRVNFFASEKRHEWLSADMPDLYVLPNRPSFTGQGTDATEYCWAVWEPAAKRRRGSIQLLDLTPGHERKARR